MNIFSFTRKLPALAVAASVALMLTLSAGQTMAQAVGEVTDKSRLKGMTDAPELIASAKLPCQLTDAHFAGDSEVPGKDGKKTKFAVYEIACQGDLGYILAKAPGKGVDSLFNCTQAWTQNSTDPKSTKCLLPANQKHYAWLQVPVQKLGQPCIVNKARWMGGSDDLKMDRYELGCNAKAGGVLDLAREGSTFTTVYDNCLILEQKKITCQFTTRDQAIADLKPAALKASATCQVSNIRWIGRVGADKEDYYEYGCANEPGFLIRVKSADGQYVQKVGCANAGSLGPCQFTDSTTLTAGQNDAYTKTLGTAGVTCTVQEYNVMGTQTQTNRDFVEFKCPEQTYGLLAFVPNEGSTGKFDSFDCFAGKARKRDCTLTATDVLTAHLDKLAKADNKDCDVKEVRYAGVTEANGILVELACANKRGYIAALSKSRKAYDDIIACNIAKNRPGYETCKIPGNGTYVSDVKP